MVCSVERCRARWEVRGWHRPAWIARQRARGRRRGLQKIILEDEDGEIDPVWTGGGGGKGEIEIDRLSAIIEEFNDLFGGIEWKDDDRVRR